jgi:hypothetical protein
MFSLLESKEEIAKAQDMLERTIRSGFTHVTKVARTDTFDNGTHWFRSKDHKVKGILKRRLNFFGLSGDDSAVVQINTPYEGRNQAIAGFFAKNNKTGMIFLFHSGRVGGNKNGVGKINFLAWSGEPLEKTVDSSGDIREGVLVMPIEGERATDSAIRYIDIIHRFRP